MKCNLIGDYFTKPETVLNLYANQAKSDVTGIIHKYGVLHCRCDFTPISPCGRDNTKNSGPLGGEWQFLMRCHCQAHAMRPQAEWRAPGSGTDLGTEVFIHGVWVLHFIQWLTFIFCINDCKFQTMTESQGWWGRTILYHPNYCTVNSIGQGIKGMYHHPVFILEEIKYSHKVRQFNVMSDKRHLLSWWSWIQ